MSAFGVKPPSSSTKSQAYLKEKSRPSPSLSPVRQLSVGRTTSSSSSRRQIYCRLRFSKLRFVRIVTVNAVFGALETGFPKGKTGWLLLLMEFLASPPLLLMNQCGPNRGRGSSSASWIHLGRRGAVKLAARLQKTLPYYQTIIGGNLICGAPRANGTLAFGGKPDIPAAATLHVELCAHNMYKGQQLLMLDLRQNEK
jgi:hypothetical protein